MLSISEAFSGRDNALNLARLAMAALVVLDHIWPIGGFGPGPALGGMPLSWWALAGFFTISGYLTTASAARLSLTEFLRRRSIRIFPGLWLCLAVAAFGLAPLAAGLAGVGYRPTDGVSYVVSNLSSLNLATGVGPELAAVPLRGIWNGSLWTLPVELGCYVVMGALARLGTLGPGAARRLVVGRGALQLVAGGAVVAGMRIEMVDALRLVAFYLAGSLAWSVRDRLTQRWPAVVACAVLGQGLSLHPMTSSLVGVPLCYLLLCFGARCPLRVGQSRDLSYGVYLYGWPVTQLAVVAGASALGPWGLLAIVAGPVVVLAWLSWRFVEAPALRWRRPAGAAAGTSPLGDAFSPVQRPDG